MNAIHGIPASSGIALGFTFLYLPKLPEVTVYEVGNTDGEVKRLERAIKAVDDDLVSLASIIAARATLDEAQVFEAHRMFLQDPMFVGEIVQQIKMKRLNAESCVANVVSDFCGKFENLEDEYFRQRSQDIADVGNRLSRALLGILNPRLDCLSKPSIIIAENLFPSDTAQMDVRQVKGFVTVLGGPTAHAAIFARSLGIPAIVGASCEILELCSKENFAILDGDEGTFFFDPDEATIREYEKRQRVTMENALHSLKFANQPAKTLDGTRVEVVANIGQVSEAIQALDKGAEGVGLLRTEFLFLDREEAPDEDEQFNQYSEIGDAFGDRPVVIRTMDIGGDKRLPYLTLEAEDNPFLGLRGLRLCLKNPEIFKVQLRAIFRASVGHNLKIMFPMVSTVNEIQKARQIVSEVLAELADRQVNYSKVEIGIMIEVPAAAVAADVLARHVDFFSIGTNDLTQYTMAADRTNSSVQDIADAFHPAVLRLIQQTIRAGHEAGIWIGLCGELAGNPLAVPLLLGMGLDEFSMGKASIPEVKETIRKWSVEKARKVTAHALSLPDAVSVRDYLCNLKPA